MNVRIIPILGLVLTVLSCSTTQVKFSQNQADMRINITQYYKADGSQDATLRFDFPSSGGRPVDFGDIILGNTLLHYTPAGYTLGKDSVSIAGLREMYGKKVKVQFSGQTNAMPSPASLEFKMTQDILFPEVPDSLKVIDFDKNPAFTWKNNDGYCTMQLSYVVGLHVNGTDTIGIGSKTQADEGKMYLGSFFMDMINGANRMDILFTRTKTHYFTVKGRRIVVVCRSIKDYGSWKVD